MCWKKEDHAQGPRPGPGTCHPLESPSCICSCPDLPLNEGHPPEALCSLQVGRTWTTAAVSSCRTCTSGTGSAPSAPSASGEKQVAGSPASPSSLPLPSPGHPGALQRLIRPRVQSFSLKIGATADLHREKDGVAGTAASEFQSLSVEVYFLSCSSLLSWACSSLTCYISFFVANENEDCSALTNEIIVTMHTFQDVSRPEGLRKGRAGEWWTR